MRTSIDHNAHLKKYRISDGLYYISTAYGRVSFIAQQWRAIQLACSLSKTLGTTDLSIGIVGGGLAGTTALVALKGLGFKGVRLYEAQSDLLQSQNSAAHRQSHPSLNFWPDQLVGGYCSTTDLPFMNWYYERADAVTAMIRDDRNLNSVIDAVSFGHIVTNIQRGNSNKLLVSWTNPVKNNHDTTEFDIVILASGFGRERNIASSASGSYWWADHIKHFRSEHHYYSDSRIYVSGSGDGALIDFCRLASKKGHIPDSAEENPAASVVGELRAERYRLFDSFGRSELPETSNWEDQVSSLYQKPADAKFQGEAIRLIKSLLSKGPQGAHIHPNGQAVSAVVKDNYRDQLDRIKMVVREKKHPGSHAIVGLSPKTSPANLLLFMAVTAPQTANVFVLGEVKEAEQRLYLATAPYDEKSDIHIARNGAEQEIGHFFDGDEFKMELEAFHSADDPEIDAIVSIEGNRAEAYPHLPAPADRETRYHLAGKFLARYFDGYLGSELLPHQNGEWLIEVRLADQPKAETQFRRLGGIEPKIFGITAKYVFEPLTATAVPAKVLA